MIGGSCLMNKSRIKSIRPVSAAQTLDLEIDHPLHQFYCNGLLTSNSHSISYTYTSFREYWLKAHYDPEFNIALLNNTSKGKEQRGESVIAQYITETLKKGYKIAPADVNRSENEFSLATNDPNCHEIVWGLGWVKSLPDITINQIINERQHGVYTSLEDFFNRVGKKLLNKRAIEALVWSGALDMFGDREEIREKFYTEYRTTKDFRKEILTTKKIIEKEIEYCSISLTEINEFAGIKKEVSKITDKQISPLYEADEEGSFVCVGKIEKVENKKTKTKKDYVRISLRDESDVSKNIYCWPWKCKNIFSLKKGMLIIANLENDGKFKNLVGYWDTETE